MTAEFDRGQFDASGIDFKGVQNSFIDESLLPLLEKAYQKHTSAGMTQRDVAGKRTRSSPYHSFRCRIIAFSNYVYPDVVSTDYRSNHLATGIIYADRLITNGFGRMRAGRRKTKSLRFAVGELINLEGPLVCATNPLAALQSHVDIRYCEPKSQYWDLASCYGQDDDDKATFMLGAGLVCHEAGLVVVNEYDGLEHSRAVDQIRSTIANLA